MAERILIVDDAAFMREMLRDLLGEEGFEIVAEAADGDDPRRQRPFKGGGCDPRKGGLLWGPHLSPAHQIPCRCMQRAIVCGRWDHVGGRWEVVHTSLSSR